MLHVTWESLHVTINFQLVVFEDDALTLTANLTRAEISNERSLCPNLGVCFLNFIDAGLRSGDIVGDSFDDVTYEDGLGPYGYRIVYALVKYTFCNNTFYAWTHLFDWLHLICFSFAGVLRSFGQNSFWRTDCVVCVRARTCECYLIALWSSHVLFTH